MPFPISYEGQFKFSGNYGSVDDIILYIESALRKRIAKILFHKVDSVTFQGKYYIGFKPFPILQMVSKGMVKITEDGNGILVNYRLEFTRLIVMCLLFAVLVILFGVDHNINDVLKIIYGVLSISVVLTILFFLEYFITIKRFQIYLMRLLKKAVVR